MKLSVKLLVVFAAISNSSICFCMQKETKKPIIRPSGYDHEYSGYNYYGDDVSGNKVNAQTHNTALIFDQQEITNKTLLALLEEQKKHTKNQETMIMLLQLLLDNVSKLTETIAEKKSANNIDTLESSIANINIGENIEKSDQQKKQTKEK